MFTSLDQDCEMYYCENFFEQGVDKQLFDTLNRKIEWEKFPLRIAGKVVNAPRENYYASEHPYRYSGYIREGKPMIKPLLKLQNFLNKEMKNIRENIPEFNAVLCNRYSDGESYIGWHSDDTRDLHPESLIVSISLGETRDFIFKNKSTGSKIQLSLKSGAVVVMGKGCQENWLHSVPKRKNKGCRINLTFRSIK